jgi:zinc protease
MPTRARRLEAGSLPRRRDGARCRYSDSGLARKLTPISSLVLSLLSVLVFLALFPADGLAADGDLSKYQLANGLGVYVYEKHTAPVASVQVWYRTGALNERPGIRGLSHLLEHMMVSRGSEHFGPKDHDSRIYEMGGWNNAATGDDFTYYFQLIPVSGVELVMEMEADRMARLKLSEDALKTEVQVVKEEYRLRYENSPYDNLVRKLNMKYLGEHPYACGPIGVMEDLEQVTAEDCLAYYRARYAPNQAALIVVGDVVPDSVLAMAERYFGPIPRGPDVEPDPPPPTKASDPVKVKSDIPVCFTGVAYRLPPAGHNDLVALEVLADLLESRIDSVLTRDREICVYAGAVYTPRKQESFLMFWGAHLPGVSSKRVCDALETAMDDYMRTRLSEREMDRVRNSELLKDRTKRYSASGLAYGIGYALTVENDLDAYWDRPAKLAALTTEDLVAVRKRYFTAENRVEISVEPEHPIVGLRLVGWFKSLFHL